MEIINLLPQNPQRAMYMNSDATIANIEEMFLDIESQEGLSQFLDKKYLHQNRKK